MERDGECVFRVVAKAVCLNLQCIESVWCLKYVVIHMYRSNKQAYNHSESVIETHTVNGYLMGVARVWITYIDPMRQQQQQRAVVLSCTTADRASEAERHNKPDERGVQTGEFFMNPLLNESVMNQVGVQVLQV